MLKKKTFNWTVGQFDRGKEKGKKVLTSMSQKKKAVKNYMDKKPKDAEERTI